MNNERKLIRVFISRIFLKKFNTNVINLPLNKAHTLSLLFFASCAQGGLPSIYDIFDNTNAKLIEKILQFLPVYNLYDPFYHFLYYYCTSYKLFEANSDAFMRQDSCIIIFIAGAVQDCALVVCSACVI